ncbi:5-hydroxyisourate hydrolase [Microlunatus phosphovorus NM-1]|uniref:5-hydroxyisourate hydrolase n=1 Tax=Microlunatus phosphovorus (strain ATCC 700054 / DSM 10555 / JCM 9379 / NBRC 101784 / NCIMB 13414 / VKM Ac-1990 / NM-1) TaxID=1032480 RepID=F5XEL1_MICPN|nr:hydroxyisourate hydrolase [Microlunatus phosphovorus]BAK35227.1 5-hydroxyisourate hydrolase [Microlunatus phosphovorus NM-1]
MTSQITSHVLDGSLGRPAAGVVVQLLDADQALVAEGATDADGRIASLGPEVLPTGTYHVVFDTGAYFAGRGVDTFYPSVTITIAVASAGAPAPHYHVPLLLSPFAYSTYRGS